jgi:DNA-binding NarL/FixJ family response regulator
LVARLVAEFRARGRRRFLVGASRSGEQLTDREWEVLQLLGEDFTTAQIAERLYIAKVTVRSHVSAVLRKLRVPDRDAAARLMRGSQHP